MKVKKRLMIALAGAMILGVFGIHGVSTMASDPPQSGFMLTIPAELQFQQAGPCDDAGMIFAQIGESNKILTVAIAEKCFENLQDQNDPYRLCLENNSEKYNDKIDYHIYNPINNKPVWEFTSSNGDIQEQYIGVEIEDYSNKMPGKYSDSVEFTVNYWERPSA